jgi:hypothetical protein
MAGKRSRRDFACDLGYSPGTPLETPLATTAHCEPHASRPAGYGAHSEWAALMMETHDCRPCHGCGKWLIWEPKENADT